MRLIIAVLALGIGAVPSGSATGPIEDFVATELPASGAPGVAYAVVTDGEITDVAGDGVVERGGDEEVTGDTPFLIGSISKSFTALAVMQLVEAGAVDLDSAISQYLPEFATGAASSVTVRQLLDHTSGYSTMQGNRSYRDGSAAEDELARRVEALAAEGPDHPPGVGWDYSNANYAVLGRLVEVASGQPYATYVTEHVLEPVGMEHSHVADGTPLDDPVTGHRPWFGTKRAIHDSAPGLATAPAGGIVASAGDMALYLQMMVNGRDDVISADSKAEMVRPAGPGSPTYGLGWFLTPDGDTAWHDGTTPGFETLAVMEPEAGNAVVVLVNAGSGMGFGETVALRNGITALGLGTDYDGEGSPLPRQSLFVGAAVLPFLYLGCMVWAWRHRRQIRAKSGFSGLFSLWFPLLTTTAAAWVLLVLVPRMFGAPLGTIRLYTPDFGLALLAGGVGGVAWAVFRLVVAYTGRARSTADEASATA